jgi:hypothetical protein
MVKLAAMCGALLSCLTFAPAPASASAAMSDPAYSVRLLAVNGTGCPPGYTAVSRASSSEFTVAYRKYIAWAGDDASPLAFRKDCQFDVRVSVPSGWTFEILEVDYRGFASMAVGALGTLTASYYYAGLPQAAHQQHSVSAPRSGDYVFTNPAAVVAWAPCQRGATLNVTSEIHLAAGPDRSFLNELTVDSSGANLSTIFHLGFTRC